jgi:hypothetical protein
MRGANGFFDPFQQPTAAPACCLTPGRGKLYFFSEPADLPESVEVRANEASTYGIRRSFAETNETLSTSMQKKRDSENMQLKIMTRTGFLLRLGVIAFFGFGSSAWFFYDGAVAYPAQAERAKIFREFKENNQIEEWKKYAEEKGWSTRDPGPPKTEADFFSQFAFGTIFAPLGPVFLFFFWRAKRRWIELTETGLRTSWGQELTFDEIVFVDKKLWKKKGIAKIVYERDGRRRKLVLDDWKYETEPTQEALFEVESHLEIDQIINGIPEAYEQAQEEEEYDEAEEGHEADRDDSEAFAGAEQDADTGSDSDVKREGS